MLLGERSSICKDLNICALPETKRATSTANKTNKKPHNTTTTKKKWKHLFKGQLSFPGNTPGVLFSIQGAFSISVLSETSFESTADEARNAQIIWGVGLNS